ncbi:hypothetical protein FIBSPDRAFT_1038921 [Athelia psychrophila]|uniref:Uncharacterized protein n=1 Tax=Athelia psychrophila TaxID=1759441 RepID=A0A166SB04_9AGAM|nr:hypothetical protein FIBSPDRAFT_1038921 [Fibularhizoctonia sp. CBS 109695]
MGAGTGCSAEDRAGVSRAWSLAAIGLAADAGTDLQESGIRAAFSPVAAPLACALCRGAVADRVDVLCARWALVPSNNRGSARSQIYLSSARVASIPIPGQEERAEMTARRVPYDEMGWMGLCWGLCDGFSSSSQGSGLGPQERIAIWSRGSVVLVPMRMAGIAGRDSRMLASASSREANAREHRSALLNTTALGRALRVTTSAPSRRLRTPHHCALCSTLYPRPA